MPTSVYHRERFFCLSGSAKLTVATLGAKFVAADMRLFEVDASAFLVMKGSTHMVALSFMQFVSHASLKVAKELMIGTGSLGSKKRVFICDFTFFNVLVMQLDTVCSQRTEQFAS